ncbi:hypothetical protein D3C81_2019090 [compost metagenome]
MAKSCVPAMNTKPAEVDIGPPRVGMPTGMGRCVAIPSGPVSSAVPNGMDQTN